MYAKRYSRFRFLHHLYQMTKANVTMGVDVFDIGKVLQLTQEEVTHIFQYLCSEDLVKGKMLGGGIRITEKGIREIENAINHPTISSDYFPAVAAFIDSTPTEEAQTTISKKLPEKQTNDDVKARVDLILLLKEIHTQSDSLKLPTTTQKELDSDLTTIRIQHESPNPKREVINICLRNLAELIKTSPNKTVASTLLSKIRY